MIFLMCRIQNQFVTFKKKYRSPFHDLATPRCTHSIQDCPPAATEQPDVPNLSGCSDETDLQQKSAPSLYPDGIFLAELVDICSPDEYEEEGEDK